MDGNSLPPVGWRYCGNQIKRWRFRAGVSREELASRAGYSVETIKAMEQGRRKPTPRVLRVADELCGAQGLLLAGEDYLQPEKYPERSQDYMRCEADAIAISAYQCQVIPGLLQTEETMRALFTSFWPPVDDETVETRVAARLERQALLENQATIFSYVIDECVLRRPMSDPAAHKRQLLHLLEAAERRNVTVQALPTGGAHIGLMGPFIVLETAEHELLAYTEGQGTSSLYTDPATVSIMRQRWALLAAQALSPEKSAEFIRRIAEEL
ncbi:helix-turn-helix transcriptional regulator [Streptomyces sp. I05A-00742]|uniref:helix-turn-helix domain-containing protein n=1 Tax=Streptomyces sp. I05A-00742 TaxID=2732853 RepID=UPI001487D42E|nr:helix-turn-helix transcriptional regulator [Streptomyces sp. I05A-00742]